MYTEIIAPVVLLLGASMMAGASVMLARARRETAYARRAAVEQAALRRVATAVADDPDEGLARLAEEAAILTGAHTALVAQFAGETARATVARNALAPEIIAPFPLDGRGALAQVARTGRPARVDDYSSLPPDDPVHGDAVWTRVLGSGVAVPVRVGGTLWGALLVLHALPRAFPPDTEARLVSFADLMVTAVTSAEARRLLTRQATTDPLTRLANRRHFEQRLEMETERALRTGRPLALVMLDIDHFKAVNDAHGHAAGDDVLREVAERLTALARPQDLLARIGGEEFAWIVTEATEADALGVAERARRRIMDEPFPRVGTLTLSAGVCDDAAAPGAGGLQHGADVALYWAKEHGRNRSARYSRVGRALPDRAPACDPVD